MGTGNSYNVDMGKLHMHAVIFILKGGIIRCYIKF